MTHITFNPHFDAAAVVRDESELREQLGEPGAAALRKVRRALHELDRQWLAASRFLLLATAGGDGSCDVSPKGDPAGLVHVLDEVTVAIPERAGNRRADGFRNILANPHVGLISLLPGRGDTLRINGRATVVRDAPFFDELVVRGSRPLLATVVEIDEVFHHCSKAFGRSGLWDPATWDPTAVASRPCTAQALERPEASLAELEQYYGPAYDAGLYPT